jgi:hypothetical protein
VIASLTFCLIIQADRITGIVDELSVQGQPPVQVTGRKEIIRADDPPTLPDTGIYRYTLEFNWDASRIFMDGFSSPENDGRRKFLGRFIAGPRTDGFVPRSEEGARANLLGGPDPGETGTGTGQQT